MSTEAEPKRKNPGKTRNTMLTDDKARVAAAIIAQGGKWADVAAQFHYKTAHIANKVVKRHPDWERMLAEACQEIEGEFHGKVLKDTVETALGQKPEVTAKNPIARVMAQKAVLDHCAKLQLLRQKALERPGATINLFQIAITMEKEGAFKVRTMEDRIEAELAAADQKALPAAPVTIDATVVKTEDAHAER